MVAELHCWQFRNRKRVPFPPDLGVRSFFNVDLNKLGLAIQAVEEVGTIPLLFQHLADLGVRKQDGSWKEQFVEVGATASFGVVRTPGKTSLTFGNVTPSLRAFSFIIFLYRFTFATSKGGCVSKRRLLAVGWYFYLHLVRGHDRALLYREINHHRSPLGNLRNQLLSKPSSSGDMMRVLLETKIGKELLVPSRLGPGAAPGRPGPYSRFRRWAIFGISIPPIFSPRSSISARTATRICRTSPVPICSTKWRRACVLAPT